MHLEVSKTGSLEGTGQKRFIAVAVALAPWVSFALIHLLAPGYTMPLLTNSLLILGAVAAVVVVSLVLHGVLQSTQSKPVWISLIMLVVVPMCFIPMLSPHAVKFRGETSQDLRGTD